MPVRTMAEWVDQRQAAGGYSFLREEAVKGSRLTPEAAKKALQRLVRRRRLAKVKDYFYVIIPLEYLAAGGPPPSWFIADLMRAMKLPYYVGLLSAAALHGASPQQPQEFQVMTDRSVRPLQVGRARIRFFVNKNVAATPVVEIKTPTGGMRVSCPEATAVDLVRFVRSAGHLDHVAAIVSELAPKLNPRRLLDVAQQAADLPNAQRLGYLLDQAHAPALAEALRPWVQRQHPHAVPLRCGRSTAEAKEDRRWHVTLAHPLEVEA